MSKNDAFYLWKGPSSINGKPIVLIATSVIGKRGGLTCGNTKTGPMTQLWIIPDGMTANQAIASGEDEAVCGECAFRPALARTSGHESCYLKLQIVRSRGPTNVVKRWLKGGYPLADDRAISRILANPHGFRWGAWGDPLAVPMKILKNHPIVGQLTRGDVRHTAYTHRWKNISKVDATWVQKWCIASVDNEEEAKEAAFKGWRYFRVREEEGIILEGERSCPASKEMGHLITCDRCRLCDGTTMGSRRPNIVIIHH